MRMLQDDQKPDGPGCLVESYVSYGFVRAFPSRLLSSYFEKEITDMARSAASPARMPSTSSTESVQDSVQISREQIALRAYEIYQERGGTDGADLDDWLEAERELQNQRS